jgi:tetratricopeptide (TPR) repeat protein
LSASDAGAMLSSAVSLRRDGRRAEAEALLRGLVAAHPAHSGALHLLGVLAMERGAAAEALPLFERARFGAPTLAPLQYNRGHALLALGRLADAAEAYRQAGTLDPQLAEAPLAEARALYRLGQPGPALAAAREAIARRADLPGAWRLAGAAQLDLSRWEEAAASLTQAVEQDPRDAEAWNRLGIARHQLHALDAALACYDRAIAIEPARADPWNNRGNALHDLRRADEARASFERALELDPASAEATNNLGMLAQERGDFGEARLAYAHAQSLRPNNAEALRRQAALNLLEGRYAEGWADYERSHAWSQLGQPAPAIRPWRGEDLRGKSILLSEPNGLGDTIQFFRFVPRLLALGARVAFHGPRAIFPLLPDYDGAIRFIADPAGERFDFASLLWSLPHWLGIGPGDIGMTVPYLRNDPARAGRWRHLLDPGAFNIGICWQGNPLRKIDAGRSVPLAAFAPLAGVPGVHLVSLQRHHGLEQLQSLPPGMRVVAPGDDFDAGDAAFADSAALMQELDLVVAADTALTHVAGGLGQAAWLALNVAPDWRWLLGREDSPWYPSVRLFRQRRLGDWGPVFEQMAEALAAQVRPKRGADASPTASDA